MNSVTMTYREMDAERDIPVWFRRRNRARAGISNHALMHDARYSKLHHGVWLDHQTLRRRVIPGWANHRWVDEAISLSAATAIMADSSGSGLTAARLFGLPLPRNLQQAQMFNGRIVVELATTVRSRQTRQPTIKLSRLSTLTPVEWYGLTVVSAADVFVHLAPVLGPDDLVKLGDAIVGRWRSGPLCSLDDLRTRIDRPYLRHRRSLTEALDLVRENVDSPMETVLRLWLRRVGLPEPVIHPGVHCSLTNRTYHPDLGHPEHRLAIEYHGDHHRVSPDQWDEDLNRRNALQAEGWTVIEVTRRSDLVLIEQSIRAHLGLQPRILPTGSHHV
ncbi:MULTISPECIES: endonuclease domain-containing protein [Brevibacterium]|uniref:endonuclease domain-containing protein n=1 Tax=Brevibacterium TaxID=1696 RepID=UPI0011BED5BA|nr:MULTISPECIES: hypothetical protein [Brevibacterium]